MTFAAKAPCLATFQLSGPSPRIRCLLALLVLAIGARAQAADRAPPENRKIQYLIATIEALSNAQFIRNGTVYEARSAADHLRLSYNAPAPSYDGRGFHPLVCVGVVGIRIALSDQIRRWEHRHIGGLSAAKTS